MTSASGTAPSTADPSTPAICTPGSPLPRTTFFDTLRELRFTEQAPHPDAVHTTFQHLGDHREILVYCHPDELAEPNDDGSCSIDIVCWQDGYLDQWRMTISHLDAIPLALAALGAAAGNNR